MTKGHLDHPEGQLQIKYPQTVFGNFNSNQEKSFFQEGHFLTKSLIPQHFIFLK